MLTMRHVMGALAGLGAVALSCLSPAAAQNPKLVVRVDWHPWGMHAGLHLAKDKGWFDQAGVDVTVTDGKGSSLVMTQIATGEVDVGWVQQGAMVIARYKGYPLKSVALLVRTGDVGMMVPAAAGYKTLKDLEGKKVGVAQANGAFPFLDKWLKLSGTSRDKMTLVQVDATSLVSVYSSGEVEGSLSAVPFFIPIVENVRPATGITLASVGINVPSYGLTVTEKTLAEKEDALRRFVPVVARAWEYIYGLEAAYTRDTSSSPRLDEAVDAMVRQRPGEKIDARVIRAQIEHYRPYFWTERTKDAKFGWAEDEDWKQAMDDLKEAMLVPASAKVEDIYTNKFVKRN